MRLGRCIAAMVALMLALVLAAPLAPTTGAAPAKVTVIASSEVVPMWEHAAQLFRQKTGVDVEIVSQGYNESLQKIVTSQVAGSHAYDITKVDTIWLAQFAKAGFLVPLDPYLSKAFIADTIPASLQQMQYDGKIWALNGAFNAKFFYYNKRLLRQAGIAQPPRTWEVLIQQAKVLQMKGLARYGIAWGWTQAEGLVCDYTLLLNALGGKYQDAAGHWTLNSGAAVKTLTFMRDSLSSLRISDPSSITLDDRGVVNLLIQGQIPYLVSWSFGWAWAQDPSRSKVVNDVGIALIPGSASAHTVSSSTGGGSGYGILRTSLHKDLASQLLQIYASPEVQKWEMTALKYDQITSLQVLKDPEVVRSNPALVGFANQFQYVYPRPILPWYAQWSSVMQLQLHRALVGEVTAQQALDEAQRQVEQLATRFK